MTLSGNNFTILAQQDLETIKYRNMVIDLGNGLNTNAQLTIPAVGNGPFPGVLLVPGSGNVDMNETVGYVRIDNETGTKIYPPVRPFFQIAEYLSDRGFVTLRYDKRGIGENNTILDSNIWGNVTSNDLKQDAEKALDVFIQQPELDHKRISIIGHSEGTIIAPRVAIDNPDKVKNLVLMGAVAENFSKIGEFQVVSLPLLYAKEVLDHTHDGLLSLKEANENPIFSFWAGNLTLILTQNKQLNPKYNTNNDIYLDIDNELKPILLENFKSQSVVKSGEKCTANNPCRIWIKSTYALPPNLDIIGNISSNTSILILQGENETQTPLQQAFLLQQKLTDVGHPDHTLITYPNLGHIFYPSSQWITGVGPIEQYVLRDLYSWLESHSGMTSLPTLIPSSYTSNTTKLNH
ncbi:MAG TPA: alpha/beta fold hydrolase [Nitrososphaeraceae archaeon]|nr:alpha/beta fold hydrolase [Nitrososphaeraceae archaeon]